MNHKLDDFFKGKFDSEKHEFQDKYWEQMERQLDQEKKRRRPLWLWISLLAFIGLIIGLLWSNYATTDSQLSRNSSTEKANNTSVVTEKNKAQTTDNQSINTNTSTTKSEKQNTQNAINTIDKNHLEKTETPSSSLQKNTANISDNSSDNSSKNHLQETSKTSNSKPFDKANLDNQLTGTNPESVSKESPNLTSNNASDVSSPFQTEVVPFSVEELDNSISKTEQNNSNDAIQEAIILSKLPLKWTSLIATIDFPFDVRIDSTEDKNNPKKPIAFAVYGEASFYPFKEPLANYPSDVFAGFSMNYAFAKKWNLQASLAHHWRRALEEEVPMTRNYRYKFGLESTEYQLIKQQEHFAEIGLLAQYQAPKKHQLGFGGGIDILFFQYGELRETTSQFPWQNEGTDQTNTLDKGQIAIEDEQRLYPYLTAQYNYQISGKWGLYLRAKHFPFNTEVETFNKKLRVHLGLNYTF